MRLRFKMISKIFEFLKELFDAMFPLLGSLPKVERVKEVPIVEKKKEIVVEPPKIEELKVIAKPKNINLTECKPYYKQLLAQCLLNHDSLKQIDRDCASIFLYKEKYKEVERLTGVPWYVVGAIHLKEASQNFSKGLHNGQPWNQVTTIVPKGVGPFSSWIEAAIDALKSAKNFHFDDVESCLYFLEKFNGFGYMLHKPILSPYLWCGTTLYVKGGYGTDGVYDPNYVIKNTGGVPIVLRFNEFKRLA